MTADTCKACHTGLDPKTSLGAKNGYALLPCPSCATVTVSPYPTPAQLQEFYQNYQGTADYRAKADRKITRARRRIRKFMHLAPGKRFLDVGCNYGFTVAAALSLGLDAAGIDIDAVAVRESQKSFIGGRFDCVPVENYVAWNRKADMIYTSEVIEHVFDPDAFVAALAKILVPGGILYLTTPDGGHFRVPRDFASWTAVTPPEHIVYFSRKGIRALLEKNGFKIRKFFFNLKPGIQLIAERT